MHLQKLKKIVLGAFTIVLDVETFICFVKFPSIGKGGDLETIFLQIYALMITLGLCADLVTSP